MSESDEGGDERNLAQQYAEKYGGAGLDLSPLSGDSDETRPGPAAPSPSDAAEVDPELRNLFWRLVLVFNVAIAALAIGPMLIFFRGAWELGLQVTLVGVLTFAYGTYRYHRFRSSTDEDEEHNG